MTQNDVEREVLHLYRAHGHPYADAVPQRCEAVNGHGERCALPRHKTKTHELIPVSGMPWSWPLSEKISALRARLEKYVGC